MATGVACPVPILQFTSNAGVIAANGSVLTQVGGINTATYQDVGLTTPLPNPIPLNSRGEVSTAAGASSQLFLTPNITYVFTLYDGPNATGNQLWQATYVNGVQFTASSIGALLYPRTQAEITAGITPTLLTSPPGAYQRYGADPLGISDSSTAISNAIKANAYAFDDYPGGGFYLVNAEVLISKSNVRITGQSRNQRPYAVLGGTVFNLTGTAGALASCLHIGTGPRTAIKIENICFYFTTANTGQNGIRIGEALGVTVENCGFIQSGGGGNLTGIRFDGLGIYTGGVVVRDCYASGMYLFSNILGICTTIKIVNNELYGNLNGASGVIAALGGITGGSGYTNGTYTAIPLTGGTGFGALANFTVAGGAVTVCTLLFGGQGYANTDTLSATSASLGGGTGFSIPVSTVGTGVTASQGAGIRIAANCSNVLVQGNSILGWPYEIDGTCTYIRQDANHFENDTANAGVYCFRWRRGAGSISSGGIPGLGAITGGSSYVNGTYINVGLTGGLGSGAVANITVAGGAVTVVDIVDNGVGYSVADTLSTNNANLGGAGSGFSVPVAAVVSNQRIWGTSLGEQALGASAFTALFPHNNFDRCICLGQIENYIDEFPLTMPLSSVDTSGFTFSNFGNPIGQMLSPAYSAGNFTASGSMSWTVSSGSAVTYDYTVIGRTMVINWFISGGTAGGVAGTALQIAIPGGFKANKRTISPCVVVNNSVASTGAAQVVSTGTFISIFKDFSLTANYTVGGVQADTYGSLTFEIQ